VKIETGPMPENLPTRLSPLTVNTTKEFTPVNFSSSRPPSPTGSSSSSSPHTSPYGSPYSSPYASPPSSPKSSPKAPEFFHDKKEGFDSPRPLRPKRNSFLRAFLTSCGKKQDLLLQNLLFSGSPKTKLFCVNRLHADTS
jgi:hypothetical protein